MSEFSWPSVPKTREEFEELMAAADQALAADGIRPFGRPLHIPSKLYRALRFEGRIFPPKELAKFPGYEGEVLIAKAHEWYEVTYGDQLKGDMAFGAVPVVLGNSLWEMRARRFWGTMKFFIDRDLKQRGVTLGTAKRGASFNVLCSVERLPQGLADRLSDTALAEFLNYYVFALEALQWRELLPRTDWFVTAADDYDGSTADVLAGRYAQARWASQQAAEKTMKGVLTLAQAPVPTSGGKGHNLVHLAGLLTEHLSVLVSSKAVAAAQCSPDVRYGKVKSTQLEALIANHAVLEILTQLSSSPQVATLLKAKSSEQ